jgi:hypothetical protein
MYVYFMDIYICASHWVALHSIQKTRHKPGSVYRETSSHSHLRGGHVLILRIILWGQLFGNLRVSVHMLLLGHADFFDFPQLCVLCCLLRVPHAHNAHVKRPHFKRRLRRFRLTTKAGRLCGTHWQQLVYARKLFTTDGFHIQAQKHEG